MSSVIISGNTSGAITLSAPDVSGTNTATLPAATGTVMVSGNMPAFAAYLSANQTIANNTNLVVPYDSEEFDTASCFNTSTYRFTPNVAGYYQLNYGLTLYNGGSGEIIVQIFKNGSLYKISTDIGGSATIWSMCGSTLAYANGSTDYFTIVAYQNSGTSRTLNGASQTYYTYFNGAMVRTA